MKLKNQATVEALDLLNEVVFANDSFSLQAKGLLSVLLAIPYGEEMNVNELSQWSLNGQAATETAYRELKNKGIFVVAKAANKNGRWQYELILICDLEFPGNDGYEPIRLYEMRAISEYVED